MSNHELTSEAIDGSGLSTLSEVSLDPHRQQLFDHAVTGSQGIPAWRERKQAEARDLLALTQIAPPGRLSVIFLDLREGLRALLRMDVPVPCRPDPHGPLAVHQGAVLGVTYPQETMFRPLPGFAFVQIQDPQRVFHANVSPRLGQRLCLGASLPAGIPLREIVLMTYGALSMQSVQVDPSDPVGVMSQEAALWWSDNLDRIPLTPTAFLEPAAMER